MINVEIRAANHSDFKGIHELINELEATTFDKKSHEEIYLTNLQNPANIYLVATKENDVIGFLSCHVQRLLHHNGKVGEIVEMIVKKEFTGKGIGQILIEHLIGRAQKGDILLLEVTSNIRRVMAHAFYEKVGFKHTHKKLTLAIQ